MKYTLKIAFVILTSILCFACSEDRAENEQQETFLYISEKVNFTEIISNYAGTKIKTPKNGDNLIYSEFESSFYIPENLSDAELDIYIQNNLSSISGTVKYMINDEVYIIVEVVNGIKSSIETNKNYFLKQAYPCSYDGIQDCVQHAVYEEWSTYTALKCAFTGGLACIADEAASCIEENCF
ncbi:hypothetical protein [Kordia jejudonensis]|uniref:hypothetical protein n=1 Tax=Kordia jejudonensis TaxID=1348245 RepID=UPI0006293FD4|nr:hypothetical protein [Kordia jejudonensis]